MSFSRTRLPAALAVLGALLAAVLIVPSGASEAGPRWASVGSATIRPGVQTYTGGNQCTSNFVFTDADDNVYLGQAAHCGSKGESTDLNGCTTPSFPVGTAVSFVTGGNLFSAGKTVGKGTLAYSSWVTMQKRKTTGALRCTWNDFALIKVSAADKGKVNPTVPFWGGPRTIGGAPVAPGGTLYTVGNSSLRSGTAKAKTATVIRHTAGGLGYEIKGGTGIPGDSGSGYMDRTGRAIGVLSTVSVGIGGNSLVSNTLGDLYEELVWARKFSGIRGLRLAVGTQPFQS